MISYKSFLTFVFLNTMLLFMSFITYLFASNIGSYICGFIFMLIKNFFYIVGIEHGVSQSNKKHSKTEHIQKFSKFDFNSTMDLVLASAVDIVVFWEVSKFIGISKNVNYFYSFLTFIPISFAVEVIFDFFHYWMHRMVHEFSFIYKFIHKKHHSENNLSAIVTFHQDPIDYILTNLIPILISLTFVKYVFCVEYNLLTYSMIITYKEFLEVAGHVDIISKKSFSFPQFIWLPKFCGIELTQSAHHNHHKHVTCNYSKRFSLWDKVFKTYKE